VNFGGMSGVVYALLGYLWVANSIAPHPLMTLPKGIVTFMIGWLVLCMTPVVTFYWALVLPMPLIWADF